MTKKSSARSKLKRSNGLAGSIFLIVMFEVIADVFIYEKRLFICIKIVTLLPHFFVICMLDIYKA